MCKFLDIWQFVGYLKWIRYKVTFIFLIWVGSVTHLQAGSITADTLTLAYCHNRVDETYPMVQQFELQQKITDLNRKIIRTGNLPQFNLHASASYQTEIPEVDIPFQGVQPVTMSRDQYSLGLDVQQNVYNGGRVDKKQKIEAARQKEQNAQTRVDLYQVKQQVSQVYFSILVSKQQMKNNQTLIEDLNEQLRQIQSKVSNGVLLPGQKYIIEAELLRIKQDSVVIASNVKAGYDILAELINRELTSHPPLKIPDINLAEYQMSKFRPEYQLFENQRSLLQEKLNLEKINKLPTVSAFGTAAYANPGLDIFDNSFNPHLLIGFSLKWNIWDAINTDRNKAIIRFQKQQIDTREDAFSEQLRSELDEISNRIDAIEENISRDQKIIELRDKVVREQSSRLENGMITSTEYITELNNLGRARVALLLRRVQLAQQKIDYITQIGYSLHD